MRNDYRFDNPLGFQVTEYRKDQETVEVTAEAGK
jgi:type IV secretion system protein VirB8